MTPTPDARWFDALVAVGAHRDGSGEAFDRLVARHGDGDRHYHGFDHAESVVDHVLALHQPGDDWAVAVLAAWYHDVVYDATGPRGANEGTSAVVAVDELSALGASLAAVGSVARLVCVTAGHNPSDGDRAGALLCDADLAVLGADSDVYDQYLAGVRAEYAHVDDGAWRTGRRMVLCSFLDRPLIYRTSAGQSAWEASARTNISRELEALG